ncbi:ArsB/NhaD family transporter [Bordetella avium]|uniref:Transporter n=1 Tax=Bordetella avium (strain 197N) TaxID=360910 RepID=Q2KU07_BORA1|nr:SLC13 family permease [Bordetella avium]AZY50569.1 transporter [Bordetella avium]AZY53966.1 transporter [Bordetella avium]RIQ15263.1 transporter [Bordetella avium]RIQ19933.1 transporter [Bordetella avium]RIQ34512.1 transporter [Bordetella avium]
MDLTLAVFLLVYVAMGVGHLPGFKLDRTGAATVGAMVLLALGYISPQAAWDAIDYRTIGLLFGLMVVSSAFVVSGFYDKAARWVGGLRVAPPLLLAILIAVGGGLSAILTNDVVVVAMTPVLVSITLTRGLNPIPFLLAFCFASNVGSAATIIGSPQNMIAAEALGLSFTGFMRVSALPALLGLPLIWLTIVLLYRGKWQRRAQAAAVKGPVAEAIPFDRVETLKAAVITLLMVGAFVFSNWPHMLIALGGAAVLLVNRGISSKNMLSRVDGDLLLLLIGLFIVNQAVAATGLPQHLLTELSGIGLHLQDPLSMLAIMSVLSNVVGNNPAVMLVAPFIDGVTNPAALGAAIALGTGFSSNMVIFGSLAGIIVAEQGKEHGVTISFWEFARAGLPVSLLCLALAVGWILYLT